MKLINKAFIIALAGVFAAGITACDPSNEKNDGPLKVEPSSLEFTAEGGEQTVVVTGNGWKATDDLEWAGIQSKDGEFVVTVIANETKALRSGKITVANNNDTKTVTVVQQGLSTLQVTPEELLFSGGGEVKTVNVTSESEWDATTEADWLQIKKKEGMFEVTASVNSGEEEREATITVENKKDSATITVTQPVQGVSTHTFDTATGAFLGLLNKFGGNSAFTLELSNETYPDNGARLFMYLLVPDTDVTYAKNQFSIPTKMDFTFRNMPMAYAVEMTNKNYPTSFVMSENGERKELSIAQGPKSKMKIEGDSAGYTITLNLTLEDGSSFQGSYTGPIDIPNPAPRPDVFVSDVDFEDMYIGLFRYLPRRYEQYSSDVFLVHGHTEDLGTEKIGENEYYKGTGWLFRASMLTAMVDDGIIPDGTYNVIALTAENARPGTIYAADSYLAYIKDGAMPNREYLRDGTVRSTYSNGQYTFEVDVYVQSGRHITGTIFGTPPPFEETAAPAPLLPLE